jgi:quercetin dioxygenase-like cupin family protein
MSTIKALQSDALAATPASPGVTRQIAFQGNGCVVLRSRGAPGTVSGWHTHGDHDVYGYLVSGSAQLETDSGEPPVILAPGSFFHVPANTMHREINPSSNQENEFVLFLRGAGPTVINADAEKKG